MPFMVLRDTWWWLPSALPPWEFPSRDSHLFLAHFPENRVSGCRGAAVLQPGGPWVCWPGAPSLGGQHWTHACPERLAVCGLTSSAGRRH